MAAPPDSRPANLVDEEWDHGDTDAAIFREGVPPKYDMDAWEGRITDDDIWRPLRDLAANQYDFSAPTGAALAPTPRTSRRP